MSLIAGFLIFSDGTELAPRCMYFVIIDYVLRLLIKQAFREVAMVNI